MRKTLRGIALAGAMLSAQGLYAADPVTAPLPPLQAEPQPNGEPPLLYRPLNATIGSFLPTPPAPTLSPTARGGSVTFSIGGCTTSDGRLASDGWRSERL